MGARSETISNRLFNRRASLTAVMPFKDSAEKKVITEKGPEDIKVRFWNRDRRSISSMSSWKHFGRAALGSVSIRTASFTMFMTARLLEHR